jgi:uncharacterized OB-fold protein
MTTTAHRPAPILTADNEFFWRAAVEHRLVAQACGSCGALRHPPRPMCPHCASIEWVAVELSGRGSVYSFAILHHPQSPMFDYPVIAALVDLDEGIRMVTNLVELSPDDVEIGLPVQVAFEATADGVAVPVFRPRVAEHGA